MQRKIITFTIIGKRGNYFCLNNNISAASKTSIEYLVKNNYYDSILVNSIHTNNIQDKLKLSKEFKFKFDYIQK